MRHKRLRAAHPARHPRSEDEARRLLERVRWPDGPACPRCGGADPYRLRPRVGSRRPGRRGLLKCRNCRRQFTVTVGTVLERTHVPLSKWLVVVRRMSDGKAPVSISEISRRTGLAYKSAASVLRRIECGVPRAPRNGGPRSMLRLLLRTRPPAVR